MIAFVNLDTLDRIVTDRVLPIPLVKIAVTFVTARIMHFAMVLMEAAPVHPDTLVKSKRKVLQSLFGTVGWLKYNIHTCVS